MATSAGSATAGAYDASAATSDQPADRAPTDAEREYLRARANDTARAVEVIEAQMVGWKQSLAGAKAAAKAAAADLKAAG